MALEYFQRVALQSPGEAGFGQEGARCVEVYRTSEPLTLDAIQDAMRELVGDVDRGDTGRLERTMPRAHPFFPWLLCRDVQVKFRGVKDAHGNTMEVVDADIDLYLDPIAPQAVQYAEALLVATFEPRPYDLLKDDDVEPASLTYYLHDDTATPSGSATDSKEYLRFVDQEVVPNPQQASFQLGQLVFRTGTDDPAGPDDGVSPSTFAGTPFILMPDGEFLLTWFAVPYSIFLDRTHPLYTQVAQVNQTAFFGWSPGQLLYMGARARRYVPTFPWYAQNMDGTTQFSSEKLCDITMRFLYTTRETTDPPDLAAVNGSWVAAGWNAQPWAKTRKFYVVTSPSALNATPDEEWVPVFNSSPMQLLFRCPNP